MLRIFAVLNEAYPLKKIPHSKLNGQLATSVRMAIHLFDKPHNDKAPFKLLSDKPSVCR